MEHDDRSEIIETTVRMAVLADRRDWDGLVRVFAPRVEVDYTALAGGEPGPVAAADLVAGWAETLGRLAVTQHLVADHLVSVHGDAATVTAAFQATHVAAGPGARRWVLGGDYRFELVRTGAGWAISAVAMTPRWETGDRGVLDPAPPLAADRPASAGGRP